MKGEKTAVSPIHSVSGCRRGVVLIPTKVTKRIRGDDGVAPTGPIYGSSRTHMPQPSLFVLTMTCGGQLINNPVSHFYREAAVPTWPGQSPPPPPPPRKNRPGCQRQPTPFLPPLFHELSRRMSQAAVTR